MTFVTAPKNNNQGAADLSLSLEEPSVLNETMTPMHKLSSMQHRWGSGVLKAPQVRHSLQVRRWVCHLMLAALRAQRPLTTQGTMRATSQAEHGHSRSKPQAKPGFRC